MALGHVTRRDGEPLASGDPEARFYRDCRLFLLNACVRISEWREKRRPDRARDSQAAGSSHQARSKDHQECEHVLLPTSTEHYAFGRSRNVFELRLLYAHRCNPVEVSEDAEDLVCSTGTSVQTHTNGDFAFPEGIQTHIKGAVLRIAKSLLFIFSSVSVRARALASSARGEDRGTPRIIGSGG
jgi:hypothetical protein